uniref:Putative farnesoic acid 0-methyl transferase n=1 Tax=Anopheles darlingi TaxID=43151 RepID=A0A2M4DB02_ANODA
MNRLANLVVLFGCCILQITGDPEAFNHTNYFDAIRGCKQYDDVLGYDANVSYFLTEGLKNVRFTYDTISFKFGILGASDGIIRFGESSLPFEPYHVTEIVIGTTKCVANRQFRTIAGIGNMNMRLAEELTPNVLSNFQPTMFTLELRGTNVVLKKFDDSTVLLDYSNGASEPSIRFMGFAKKTADMIYFYDCPWEKQEE